MISLLPARLAHAARVPLLPIVASFQDGFVKVRSVGGPAEESPGRNHVAALQDVVVLFEHEIRHCPAIWSQILKKQAAA
jgi:hypothetical protein